MEGGFKIIETVPFKDLMQGKLFQRCTHLLYYSVLSLGGNVNIRRMSKPDMGSMIFHIKNQWNILVIGSYFIELSKWSKFNSFNLLGYQTNTDASILVYKFRPERTGFPMYAEEYSVYTTTINFPCIRTLVVSMKSHPGADTGYRIQDTGYRIQDTGFKWGGC